MIKLNLGGGPNWSEEGWENLDIATGHELTKKLLKNYDNNSVDIIYTSHCLEHLPWQSVDAVLKDCYRALKPAGLIRIVLPDIDILWEIIRNQDRALLEKNNPKYYCSPLNRGLSANQCVYELFGYNREGESFLKKTMHTSFFNKSSISIMLSAAGFNTPETSEFCKSSIKELQSPQTGEYKKELHGFDNSDTQDISLFLECRK
jgi:ubiquinone/menaquinone biosynthesis C-methylase UbiE